MYSVIFYFNSAIFILILFLSYILYTYITQLLFWCEYTHRHPASSELPIVRIATRICATHVHSYDRARSTNAESTVRRWKSAARGEGKGVGEAVGLLPLVQADGTKSIMYKDVKRNGSEMLFSGPTVSGWMEKVGVAGGRGGEEEQWTRGTAERRMRTERGEEGGGNSRRRKVRYAKLRERADASGRLGRNEPCEKEELYLRPTMCKVAARVLAGYDAMRCQCYGTPDSRFYYIKISRFFCAKKIYESVCPVFRKLSRKLNPFFKKINIYASILYTNFS